MFATLISVALGGAFGASSRFLMGHVVTRVVGASFPWATLAVNVVGSFLMGLLVVVLSQSGQTRMNPFLLTGVLGGFTTFSAFSLDAVAMYERGQVGMAASYVAASVIFSIAGLIFGFWVARSMSA